MERAQLKWSNIAALALTAAVEKPLKAALEWQESMLVKASAAIAKT